jgi:hypothetical protein
LLGLAIFGLVSGPHTQCVTPPLGLAFLVKLGLCTLVLVTPCRVLALVLVLALGINRLFSRLLFAISFFLWVPTFLAECLKLLLGLLKLCSESNYVCLFGRL